MESTARAGPSWSCEGFRVSLRQIPKPVGSRGLPGPAIAQQPKSFALRILYVVHQFLPRHRAGTELYTFYLAREMVRRGHAVAVYATEIHSDQEQYGLRRGSYEGIPLFEVVHNHIFPTFRHTYRDKVMEQHFEAILEETRPDLVHFQHLHLHSIGYIDLVAKRSIPMVYTLHEYILMCPRMGQLLRPGLEICPGPEPRACARCAEGLAPPGPEDVPLEEPPRSGWDRLKDWFQGEGSSAQDWRGDFVQPGDDPRLGAVIRRRQALARRLPKVDLFISPSAFLRQRFIDEGWIDADRIIHSDNGFPVELFDTVETAEGAQEQKIRFGFVGTIADFKGVHLLVEAFHTLEEPGVSCQIHGDLEVFPDYKERLLAMEGASAVEFRGPFEHKEIGRILSGIDVLIVPSLWFENSPLTIHEAFLAGVPVLTVDQGGMAELVEDGRNGLHFRMGDVDDLRQKIQRLCREPGLLEELRRFPRLKTIAEDGETMEGRYRELLPAQS